MSPRRRVPDRWPWPADSPLDRSRRIAGSYREALWAADPRKCKELDDRAAALGQGWVVPHLATAGADDLLDIDELAAYCNIKPRTVDAWVERGLPVTSTPDGRRFLVRDVWEWQAQKRKRRAAGKQKAG